MRQLLVHLILVSNCDCLNGIIGNARDRRIVRDVKVMASLIAMSQQLRSFDLS